MSKLHQRIARLAIQEEILRHKSFIFCNFKIHGKAFIAYVESGRFDKLLRKLGSKRTLQPTRARDHQARKGLRARQTANRQASIIDRRSKIRPKIDVRIQLLLSNIADSQDRSASCKSRKRAKSRVNMTLEYLNQDIERLENAAWRV